MYLYLYIDLLGLTALMIVASQGNLPMVKMLVDAGANKRLRDARGNTALNYARLSHEFGNISPDSPIVREITNLLK